MLVLGGKKMKPLEEIYKGRFFARRDSLIWRAEPVCEAINTAIGPKSVMDVGCAIGDFVHYWENNLNVEAYGIEGSENAREYFLSEKIFVFDLREEIKLNFSVDLVTCFEVAEHIEPEYADRFLTNLAGMSAKIVMSAASPGQGGHYHVNCQPSEYWLDRMAHLGYYYDESVVHMIRTLWEPWRKKKEMSSYIKNLFYFERR
jgi:hypothetical protein